MEGSALASVSQRRRLSERSGPALERSLGLWQVSLAGIGVVLGAGVYALVGPASAAAGNALWLAFLFAGLAASATAYSYARLGTRRPKDSPEFQYTSLAFGARVGFLAGWLMLAADLLATAAVALGFGGYLAHLIGTPIAMNAFVLIVILGLVIFAGIGESVTLVIVFTLIETAGLLFIVVSGVQFWPSADYTESPRGLAGVWSAGALIFFAYLGFDELGNLAEEMRRPERDLPWALIITMAATTAIYMGVAFSATGAVGWQALSTSQAPLALVARRVLGAQADTALSLMALVATANTVLLLLVSAGRSVYGMASSGVLPSAFRAVGGTRVPTKAAALVLAIAAGLVLIGDLARAAEFTNAAMLTGFMLVNLSLLSLSLRGRDGKGRLRTQIADVAIPSFAVLTCGWLFLHTGTISILVALALVATGYVLGRTRMLAGQAANSDV